MNPRTIRLRQEEVRSALAGELRQVRRALSPQPELAIMDAQSAAALRGAQEIGLVPSDETPRWRWRGTFMMPWPHCIRHMSPFGPPGTVLIGKEVWCPLDLDYRVVMLGFELRDGIGLHIAYKADHIDPKGDGPGNPMPWRSPATMPAWAARIRLVNRGVRIERVDGEWEWIVDVERLP
jgi:hypothetical protein